MPKKIGNVRERISENAREMLLAGNLFSVRELCDQCGIATGTLYNYFPNREAVIAAVMSDSWKLTLQEMDEAAAASSDFRDGCGRIFNALLGYIRLFEPVFLSYGRTGRYEDARLNFHKRFRSSLTAKISLLSDRFSAGISEDLLPVLGEVLITSAIGTDLSREDFEALVDLIASR
ncbi:MAG: TetR/AcrR family transcriptional regulator [Lachnospiraceae bacterium]|nr:TetR/AcrR family transcriptional regulator [Lachnospiraceae bacterium]